MGNGAGLREAWGARFDNDEKRTLIEDAFGHITVKAVGFRVRSFDPKRIELGVDFTAPEPPAGGGGCGLSIGPVQARRYQII
jgi:hypothetical protein